MMTGESYPDEDSFHRAWLEIAGAANEVELALAGGALADRLAWVFMSGYQAAVRRCFPEFGPVAGWTCFAAAEPDGGRPFTMADDGTGLRIDGVKSWIAGAGRIEHMVVSIGEGEARCFVQVPGNSAGLRISLPRERGFLGEMTQGVAEFEQVRIATTDVLRAPERALWFRGAEPLFVMLALNACLRSGAEIAEDHDLTAAADRAIHAGRPLADALAQKHVIVPGLVHLRTLTGQTVAAAKNVLESIPTLGRSWQKDGRLLKMFGVEGAGS